MRPQLRWLALAVACVAHDHRAGLAAAAGLPITSARAGITRKHSGLQPLMFELLSDPYRCADGGILVKSSRHSFRQPNTTVGRGKGRHIALMHRVAAPEEHGIRHLRTIEMRA